MQASNHAARYDEASWSLFALLGLRPQRLSARRQNIEQEGPQGENTRLMPIQRARFAWIEGRVFHTRRMASAEVRAARAAMQLREDPLVPIETLAERERITRRQLERDFGHWIGTSPRKFVNAAATPISRAFRAATGGGTVYL